MINAILTLKNLAHDKMDEFRWPTILSFIRVGP